MMSTEACALTSEVCQDCEFVAANDAAVGGAQLAVQKRVTQIVVSAKRLVREALKHRDPCAHDCRMHVEGIEAHLGNIQKNMMIEHA